MIVKVVVLTTNRALAVRTLHALLRINKTSILTGLPVEFSFVNSDIESINKVIKDNIKMNCRLLFMDYGCAPCAESLGALISDIPHAANIVVAPVVSPGIDWDGFKARVKKGVEEPIHQMGLNFDVKLGTDLGGDFWTVEGVPLPKIWGMDTKPVFKKLKQVKGKKTNKNNLEIPLTQRDLFTLFVNKKVKIVAYTAASCTTQFQHECISNIFNAHGLSFSSHSPSEAVQ